MKPILKTITGLGAGALIAGAGIGVYFATQNITEKQEHTDYKFSEESSLTITVKNDAHVNANTLHIFKGMIEAQQFSGSEETMLKEIVLGSISRKENANGTYARGVINIDSESINNNYHFANDFDLAYYMYQIYSHEYLHFVADTYLNGNKNGFNTTFINDFKRLLHYNDVSPKFYSNSDIKPGFKSYGSIQSAKSLYEFANYDKPLNSTAVLGSKYVMAPLNPIFDITKNRTIKESVLKYEYSASELFARKFMLINAGYIPTLNNNMDSIEGFRPDGFINYTDVKTHKLKTNASPYLYDVLNFKRELNSNNGVYLQDNPFAAKIGLEKLYARVIGNVENEILNTSEVNSKIKVSGNSLVKETNGKLKIPASIYKYIGLTTQNQKTGIYYKIKTKRKVQVLGNGRFITRDIFFTDHVLPKGTDLSKLSLYSEDKHSSKKLTLRETFK